jgi:teichuronic acid biosynthesis glycosyltransferase TuaC
MRICSYTYTALPKIGGQELVVDCLARGFLQAGHEVVVLTARPRDSELRAMGLGHGDLDATSALPYPLVRHPRFRSTRWFVAWYGRWLARLHRLHRFDLIHCHDVYPCGYVAARCAAVAGVPLVITSHGTDLDPTGLLARKPELRDRYRLALERADAAIAVGQVTEQGFGQLCPGLRRLERIPNGVDVGRYAAEVPRPPGVPPAICPRQYLLFLGRLEHRKGADLALEAFGMAAGRDLGLVIAGAGSQEPALRSRAAALGLGDHVWFAGQVTGDTKTWLLRSALCTLMPSRISEGFPLTLLESYAAGRPAIAADIPGLGSLIEPQRTGWRVTSDSAAELARAIISAVADRQQADRFGLAGRGVAQAYDWQQVIQRHLELFTDLTAQHGAKAA